MKTKLLLSAIFLIAIVQKGFAQPYQSFLNSSTWNLTVANFGGATDYIMESGVNVVIGALTYRKITDPIYNTDFYIREDLAEKKIYRRINNADELLYDFSLPVGGSYITSFGSVYTVTLITPVTVNGGTRRKFYLDNGFFGFSWIEGVGSPNHPLIPYYELPSDPYIYVTCSAQNGLAVYNHGLANGGTPTDCTMLGIEENHFAESVTFSPNPFSSELQINSDKDLNNASLKLFNSLGQVVKEIQNINGRSYILHRENFSNGLYYVQLSQGSKTVTYKKVIIQN